MKIIQLSTAAGMEQEAILYRTYALCDDGTILVRNTYDPETEAWKVFSDPNAILLDDKKKAPYIYHAKFVEISVSGASSNPFGPTMFFDVVVARCEDGTILRRRGYGTPEPYAAWELVAPPV